MCTHMHALRLNRGGEAMGNDKEKGLLTSSYVFPAIEDSIASFRPPEYAGKFAVYVTVMANFN